MKKSRKISEDIVEANDVNEGGRVSGTIMKRIFDNGRRDSMLVLIQNRMFKLLSSLSPPLISFFRLNEFKLIGVSENNKKNSKSITRGKKN